MILDASNAASYLQDHGYLASGEVAEVCELDGGVSNFVVRVSRRSGDDLVLKQARSQLRVAEPWFCSPDRIWREVEVLSICEGLLARMPADGSLKVSVPRLLFEDRDNHLYAMSAAPIPHVVWKTALLAGEARTDIAHASGTLLGSLHAGSWHSASVAQRLDDRQFFDSLRLDPYYRHVARTIPELADAMDGLIGSVLAERHCLVHGDYSPKNLLLASDQLMLIDFEVGHYGDPAFDIGFFLAHLMLKAFHHTPTHHERYFELIESFWKGYSAKLQAVVDRAEYNQLVRRGIRQFAGCAIARLDGKSRVDYLNNEVLRNLMRKLCTAILAGQVQSWDEVRESAAALLKDSQGRIHEFRV